MHVNRVCISRDFRKITIKRTFLRAFFHFFYNLRLFIQSSFSFINSLCIFDYGGKICMFFPIFLRSLCRESAQVASIRKKTLSQKEISHETRFRRVLFPPSVIPPRCDLFIQNESSCSIDVDYRSAYGERERKKGEGKEEERKREKRRERELQLAIICGDSPMRVQLAIVIIVHVYTSREIIPFAIFRSPRKFLAPHLTFACEAVSHRTYVLTQTI